jgi:hypothetical protein
MFRLLTPALSSFGEEREILFCFVDPGRRSFSHRLPWAIFFRPFRASGFRFETPYVVSYGRSISANPAVSPADERVASTEILSFHRRYRGGVRILANQSSGRLPLGAIFTPERKKHSTFNIQRPTPKGAFP